MAFTKRTIRSLSQFFESLVPSEGRLNLLRSLYPYERPILVCGLTRWYWYGNERYCKCCLYEVIFESLEHANLARLEYAAESGCRRCRIISSGIKQFFTAHKATVYKDTSVQMWDTPGAGLEFLLGTSDAKGPIALEFYFHEDGHALYPWMKPRPKVEHRSDTAKSFQLIETWIDRCATTHKLCRASHAFVPSRLIDVNKLRLVTQLPQGTKYAALSHTWGLKQNRKVPMPVTMKKTLSDRLQGFEWTELTKTFQDAFRVAIALRLKYIWIDSLCIIQDDAEDWAVESSQMSSIYGGAHIVISATRSAIGDDGIFHSRPAQIQVESVMVRPRLLHHIFTDPNASHFEDNPLFSRGWCFQERLLARRVIHFSADELVWECNEDLECECGGIKHSNDKNFKMRLGSVLSQDDRSKRFNIWSEIIRAYTNRELTFETDRLPALSGTAQRFQTPYSGRYLGGLWENDLPACLLWTEIKPEPSKRCFVDPSVEAPSWAWLSLPKSRIFPLFESEHERQVMAKVRHVECHAVTSDPYGQISGGQIILEAPITEVHLQTEEIYRSGMPNSIEMRLVKYDIPGYAGFFPDSSLSQNLQTPGTPFSCLAIHRSTVRVNPVSCLLLIRVVGMDNTYRRIGIVLAPVGWFEAILPCLVTIV